MLSVGLFQMIHAFIWVCQLENRLCNYESTGILRLAAKAMLVDTKMLMSLIQTGENRSIDFWIVKFPLLDKLISRSPVALSSILYMRLQMMEPSKRSKVTSPINRSIP